MTAYWQSFGRPLLLLGGLLAAGLMLRLLPEGGVAGLLAHEVGEHRWWQAFDLLVAGAALCAVGVPRQVICYASGLALGRDSVPQWRLRRRWRRVPPTCSGHG